VVESSEAGEKEEASMKATIYTRDGDVCREVQCDKIEPYACGLYLLVDTEIYTNQPMIVSGQYKDWEHMLSDRSQMFDVTLTIGKTVKKWEGAKVLLLLENLFSFWHGGEWHSVVGQVIIENMRDGVPVEVES